MTHDDIDENGRIKVTRADRWLRDVLTVVYMVPGNVQLPHLTAEAWQWAIPEVLKELPALRNWLSCDYPVTDDAQNPSYRYRLARSWVETLRAVVQEKQFSEIPVIVIPDREANSIRIDNKLVRVLEKIKLDRLRECKVCHRIFYFSRIEAQQCGNPKCKSTWSSRLERDPELKKKYYLNRLQREAESDRNKKKKKRADSARKR